LKLAYVSARFPFAPAEQFFEAEVRSLSQFFELTLVPTRATTSRNSYPDLPGRPFYLGILDARVIALALRELVRDPLAVARVFATVAFGRSAPRARVVNLALFPKALAFAHEARRLGFEHMHVNWITSSATIVYVASRLTGIPFSITAHQHDIFFDNLTLPKLRAVEFVRVISARNCAHLQERLPPDLRGKCRVVHLGVELPREPAAAAPREAPRIICSARMCSWKGHRYLLAALAQLRDEGRAFSVDFAGDGEIRGEVEAAIAKHGLGDRVRMLGNVPHGKLVAKLESGAYDIAVLASTESGDEHEGIPVALMEAMAVRLPVVATRTGSIPELVDSTNGILVEQRDPAALATALRRLFDDPGLRAILGERGRERVLASFSSAETSRRLAELLVASSPWYRTQVAEAKGQKSPA
jgi:glycosyltransferase involved in cell wall biosynthesis